MDKVEIAGLFRQGTPLSIETKNTSHGDEDYRDAVLMNASVAARWTTCTLIRRNSYKKGRKHFGKF